MNGPLNNSRLSHEASFLGLKSIGWSVGIHSYEWTPPTDVYETEAAFVVRLEVAGMKDQDFSIEYEDNFMVIRGIREGISERRAYQQMEIRYGEFISTVEIPMNSDPHNAEVQYLDGFLSIIIPKIKPTFIKITG